jgi:hypothetical protein
MLGEVLQQAALLERFDAQREEQPVLMQKDLAAQRRWQSVWVISIRLACDVVGK